MSAVALAERLERFLQGTWTGSKRVQGLQGGARALVLSLVVERARRPIVIVAPGARDAENLYEDLHFFLGAEASAEPLQNRVHLFPSWEVLPFENLSPHPENIAGRLEGLYKLVEESAPILIGSPAALMQRVISKEALRRSYLYLVAGQELARETLLEHLVQWGYQNVPLVEERGDFSVRGGIVDLFSPGYGRPLRLEFDGDRLDAIREFNPTTQRSERVQEEMLLLPMKEFSLKGSGLDRALRQLDQRALELDVDRREKNSLIESLRSGIPYPGMEFLVPYFCAELAPVFSYFPKETLIWLDGADRVEAEAERFGRLSWERNRTAQEERRLVAPVEALYLNEHQWRDALAQFSVLAGESLTVMAASDQAQAATMTVESYLTTDIRQEATLHGREASLAPLVDRLKKWHGEKVLFAAPTAADAGRLAELLGNYDLPAPLSTKSVRELILADSPNRAIVCGQLHQSFRLPEAGLILLTFDEIFGTHKRPPASTAKKYPSHFLTSLSELKQDDYVVHLDHGIGVYRGLKFLKVADVEGEFLHLEYAGGDRMYLPVDRINVYELGPLVDLTASKLPFVSRP